MSRYRETAKTVSKCKAEIANNSEIPTEGPGGLTSWIGVKGLPQLKVHLRSSPPQLNDMSDRMKLKASILIWRFSYILYMHTDA